MRQNTKQWSFWYFVVCAGVGLFILKFIYTNTNSSQSDIGDENERCKACLSGQHEAENVVPVPLSQIMSGKPIVLPQDDKRIIDFIWSNNHIHPPSNDAYNLLSPDIDPSRGQSQFIRHVLKNMTKGFFVECGALDGETRSNTLFMEMNLGWKVKNAVPGLLVEGDPINFALMTMKNRKAWIANTCLAIKPYPHTAHFRQNFNVGKVLNTEEVSSTRASKFATVQCMPLFSLLTAINVTTVDYFSLDVEGSELQVLKTIPFDKVYIRTLSVEYIHTTEGKVETIDFMKSQGYKMIGEVHFPNNLANDLMFVHKDVELDET